MESYSFIMDSLYETIYEMYNDEELDEETVRMYVKELMEQNVCFEMCRVYDDAPNDIEISYEDFVEKYKAPEILIEN